MQRSLFFLRRTFAVLCLFFVGVGASLAQDAKPEEKPKIEWQKGPMVADLGGQATIKVPQGMLFADGKNARKFLELNHNPPSGDEVGMMIPVYVEGQKNQDWFMLFEFNDVGYVDDSDKSKLDSGALLESIKKGTEAANKERQAKGWVPFHIIGWSKEPFFDDRTKNLTWGIVGQDENAKADDKTINYSVRVLGRRGTMNVDLILDPVQMETVVPQFNALMDGFAFKAGSRYAEFVKGDKVAGYGLAALIGGGAAAVAVKTGLFAKLLAMLVAFWKVIAVGLAAIGSRFKAIWEKVKGMFGGKKTDAEKELERLHNEQRRD